MNKPIFALAVALAAVAAIPAYAATAQSVSTYDDEFFFKPYVGADYQDTAINYKSFDGVNYSHIFAGNLSGANIHVGARVQKYLGFEVGYSDSLDGKKSNILGVSGLDSKAKAQEFTLDALGYLPVDEAQKFELIGTTGLAETRAHGTLSYAGYAASESGTKAEWRIGGGGQYWLTDNLNARVLVRYQTSGFDTIDNSVVTTAGLNYSF